MNDHLPVYSCQSRKKKKAEEGEGGIEGGEEKGNEKYKKKEKQKEKVKGNEKRVRISVGH